MPARIQVVMKKTHLYEESLFDHRKKKKIEIHQEEDVLTELVKTMNTYYYY
jgi:hypothetical protein